MKVVVYSDDGNKIEFKGKTAVVSAGEQVYIGGVTAPEDIFRDTIAVVYSAYTSLIDLLKEGEEYSFDMYLEDLITSLDSIHGSKNKINSNHTTMEINRLELLKQALQDLKEYDEESINKILNTLGFDIIKLDLSKLKDDISNYKDIDTLIDEIFNQDDENNLE